MTHLQLRVRAMTAAAQLTPPLIQPRTLVLGLLLPTFEMSLPPLIKFFVCLFVFLGVLLQTYPDVCLHSDSKSSQLAMKIYHHTQVMVGLVFSLSRCLCVLSTPCLPGGAHPVSSLTQSVRDPPSLLQVWSMSLIHIPILSLFN